MPFTTLLQKQLTGTTIYGRPVYRLTDALVFEVHKPGALGYGTVVPVDFETDLASAPYGFRWLLKDWPEPAVLHDYLCKALFCSRFFADAMFREAMASEDVPLWRRVLAYYAVRCYAVITRKA